MITEMSNREQLLKTSKGDQTMTIENRINTLENFPTHVQLSDDEVISLTVTPDEAYVSVTMRRNANNSYPSDIYTGRTREIDLTARTGNRTAKIADAMALIKSFNLSEFQADLAMGFHDYAAKTDDREAATEAVNEREDALILAADQAAIDDSDNSGVTVWSADEWLQDVDEPKELTRTDEEIVAEALSENIILIDVAEWREEVTERLKA